MLGFIISPAKKMDYVDGPPYATGEPRFMSSTQELLGAMQSLSYEKAKELWRCSDSLAELNYDRIHAMDFQHRPTAAVLAYKGLQFQYLNATVMSESELDWVGRHLRIVSAFYGVLRPFDGVVPYRLEMSSKLSVGEAYDLYDYWGSRICDALYEEFDCVVNLASVEYAKSVTPWVAERNLRFVTCLFGSVNASGKLVQRPTVAKTARGCFARWCAEQNIDEVEKLKLYNDRNFAFDETRSDENTYTFVCPS